MYVINNSNLLSCKCFFADIKPFKKLLTLKERCCACALLILIGVSIACRWLHYVWKKYYRIELKKTSSQFYHLINDSKGVQEKTPSIKTQVFIKESGKAVAPNQPKNQFIDDSVLLKSLDQDKESNQLSNSISLDSHQINSELQQLNELFLEAIVKKDDAWIDKLCIQIKHSGNKIPLPLRTECVKKYMNSIPKCENLHILFENQPSLFKDPTLISQILEVAINNKDQQLIDQIIDKVQQDKIILDEGDVQLLYVVGDFPNIRKIFYTHHYLIYPSQIKDLLLDAIHKKDQESIDTLVDYFKRAGAVRVSSNCIEQLMIAKDYKNLKVLFDLNHSFTSKNIFLLVKNAIEKNDQWVATLSGKVIRLVFEGFLNEKNDLALKFLFEQCKSQLDPSNLESFLIYTLKTDVPIKSDEIIDEIKMRCLGKIDHPTSTLEALINASKYEYLYSLIEEINGSTSSMPLPTQFNSRQITTLFMQAILDLKNNKDMNLRAKHLSIIFFLLQYILSRNSLKIDLTYVDTSNKNCIDCLFELSKFDKLYPLLLIYRNDQTLLSSNQITELVSLSLKYEDRGANIELINVLQQSGASIDPSMIHLALEKGDQSLVKLFVTNWPNLLDEEDPKTKVIVREAIAKRECGEIAWKI